MADQQLQCVDCPNVFPFSDGELKFYQSKGLSVPKRCKDCRAKRKAGKNAPQKDNRLPEESDEMHPSHTDEDEGMGF